MALSRIGSSTDFASLLARSSVYATTSQSHASRSRAGQLHASVVRHYPDAPTIPLPSNVSEIFNIETSRFAPERARDIAAPVFLHGSRVTDKPSSAFGFADSVKMQQLDGQHLDSYDCYGTVSLNGSMQTNVPKPFCSSGKATSFNMPGGMFARDGKYLAEIMRKNHFTVYQMRHVRRSGGLDGLTISIRGFSSTSGSSPGTVDEKMSSADKKLTANEQWLKLSKKERLQILVRDYGRTVIVFHVAISLVSLGVFYSLVSSGLDMTPVIKFFAGGDSGLGNEAAHKIMSEGSTFLVAYSIHKMFAPVRISLTLGVTPILVRYLRRKGILKPPKMPAN